MLLIMSCIISGVISVLISTYLKRKYENYNLTNKNMLFILLLDIVFNTALNINLYTSYKNAEINIVIYLAISILLSVVASSLASSFMIDVLFKEIPDENNLLLGIALFLVSLILTNYNVIYTAILLFVMFFILSVVTNQFGMGDVKMMSMMGLGFPSDKILSFIFVSFFLASIYSVFKILLKKNKDNNIAFGPFLIISFLILMY